LTQDIVKVDFWLTWK